MSLKVLNPHTSIIIFESALLSGRKNENPKAGSNIMHIIEARNEFDSHRFLGCKCGFEAFQRAAITQRSMRGEGKGKTGGLVV